MVTFTPRGLVLPDPPTILVENLLEDPLLRDQTFVDRGSTGTLTEVLVGGPNGNGYFEYDMTTANTISPMSSTHESTRVPVEEGETYNVSGWWYMSVAGGSLARFDVNWYNAAGSFISNAIGSDLGLTAGDFFRKDIDVVPPAGAAFGRPAFIWSGIYSSVPTLRMADMQMTKGAGVKDFTPHSITGDDGDIVNVGHLNANLDRISLLGIGGRPVLSSERPLAGTPDSTAGSLIYETDVDNLLVRRRGVSKAQGNADADWRAVIPGVWRDYQNNNLFVSLRGSNNTEAARYMLLGRICFVHIEFVLGSGGSIEGSILFSGLASGEMPARSDDSSDDLADTGYGDDAIDDGPWPVGGAVAKVGSNYYYGKVLMNGNKITIREYTNSNIDSGNIWDGNTPTTWASGSSFSADFWYFTT